VFAARHFVDRTLNRWNADDVALEARLLTSELVTNTIVHAHSDVDVHIHLTDDCVRVEVEDHAPAMPSPVSASPDAISGRGLQIVSKLASAWGVSPRTDGKVVWFELPTRAASAG